MYDNILIPTDGSTETEQAVSHGLGLARTYDATVHALYVADESEFSAVEEPEVHEQLRTAAEAVGRRSIDDIAEAADEFDLAAAREFRRGTPYEEILDYVETQNIDLVVMGTHGRSGVERGLGSTTLRVVRTVDVPTLTVRFREGVDVDPTSHYEIYDDVLVATDGSDGATAAAEHAIDIAELYGATVHAHYIVDTSTYAFDDVPRSIVGLLKEGGTKALSEIEAMCEDRDIPIKTTIGRGRPSQRVLAYADDTDVDLLTLGAHGRTSEVHLGSTTERVIRKAERPTLTVW